MACVPVLVSVGCFSGLDPDGVIACTGADQCPADTLCSSEVGFCVPANPIELDPPALAEPLTFTPATGAIGTQMQIRIVSDEPLLLPPVVTFGAQRIARTATPVSDVEYTLAFRVARSDDVGRIDVALVDRAGNATVADGGALPADATPPELLAFEWDGDPTPVGLSSSASFSGATGPDTQSINGRLVDGEGSALAALAVTSTRNPQGSLEFNGLIDFTQLELSTIPEEVTVQLDLRDQAGNRLPAGESRLPTRRFDATAPVTTLITGPNPISRNRFVAFDFEASEAADFECSFDEVTERCVPPVEREFSLGPHRVSFRARDIAGNIETSPVHVDFDVVPEWQSVLVHGTGICGLGSDETLACWGNGLALSRFERQTTLTPLTVESELGATGFRDVEIEFSARSTDDDGTLCAQQRGTSSLCWGQGPHGAGDDFSLGQPTPTPVAWSRMALSPSHRCAIDEASALWCWGSNTSGAVGVTTPLTFVLPQRVGGASDWEDVQVGEGFSCGIRREGSRRTVWCWGEDSAGVLGNGDAESPFAQLGQVLSPAGLSGEDWLLIRAGDDQVCGIHREASNESFGSLWCWGRRSGCSDDDSDTGCNQSVPTRVGTDNQWRSVDVGPRHSCALNTRDEGYCWGSDRGALLAPDGRVDFTGTELIPVPSVSGWRSLSAGEITCGVSNTGQLHCWGSRAAGQLGDGLDETAENWTEVLTDGERYRSISAGEDGTCAVTLGGELRCWGAFPSDQFDAVDRPHAVDEGSDWTQVSFAHAFSPHICAVREERGERTAWCWGSNTRGELGNPEVPGNSPLPVLVGGTTAARTDWLQVEVAQDYSVGIREDSGRSSLWWWGKPIRREDEFNVPTIAAAEAGWIDVSGGRDHLCAVRSNGTLWCWGEGQYGKLGLGAEDDFFSPQQVATGTPEATGWNEVAVSNRSTCAIREDELWCWGSWANGNEANETYVPTQVAGLGWTQLDSGHLTACGLRTDGSAWAWGEGFVESVEPVHLGFPANVNGFVDISCRREHLCAVASDGRAFCLGAQGNGELGDGNGFGPSTVELPRP
ncbi:MAG: hypothetical protein AAFU77_04645 [Myxococcota bacterium]